MLMNMNVVNEETAGAGISVGIERLRRLWKNATKAVILSEARDLALSSSKLVGARFTLERDWQRFGVNDRCICSMALRARSFASLRMTLLEAGSVGAALFSPSG
jgi:hypothetical protein